MLRANVGLSRKVTRDFQSSGYSLTLDAEILGSVDDPELVLGRIQELFSLANEALDREVERDQSEVAIGRRDEKSSQANHQADHVNTPPGHTSPPVRSTQPTSPPSRSGNSEPATPKHVQFINTLAKRQRLSLSQLEALIRETLGRPSTLQQVPKKEAGAIIEALNGAAAGNGRNGESH